jgi:exodeoxyribonuclease VII large subunit
VGGGTQDVISVAELDRKLRRAVEAVTGQEWVEGEVSSLRRAPSGHVYFCLKDEREEAVVDCVMYRLQAQRARRILSEGARVQLLGRVTVWAPRGRLQLIGETARLAGRGALLEALEQLKQVLAAEGLFDTKRKRPLPSQPKVVGVVTSAAGAAFHDICTVAFRRGGARLVLSPATVQGEAAALSLLQAIDLIERYPGLDVLIVGRGGGSADDLMVFNDERVVRRLAEVKVPVVSAVGHEIDFTLTDLVADVRAATPSQAAELVIPDSRHRHETLARSAAALSRAMHARLSEDRHAIDRLRSRLSDPRFLIADRQQLLDELCSGMERQIKRSLIRRRSRAEQLYRRLSARHPRAVLAESRLRLKPLALRLDGALRFRLQVARALLGAEAARLDALSPLTVLGRGYAIATHRDGRAIRAATELQPGDEITVRLHQGTVDAQVSGVSELTGVTPDATAPERGENAA